MANPDELKRAANSWSAPLVVREYDADKRGRQAFEEEARTLLLRGGYAAEGQTVDGGHIHAGRLILTGGFSILAGRRGIRSKGKLTVTFKKLGGPPTDLIVERAAKRRGNDAITEVAGRRPARDSYPLRLLSNAPRAHAEAVAEYLQQNQCEVRLVALDEMAAPAQALDFLDQMERLASLRDRGMLTEAEFATKKAEILESSQAPAPDQHRKPGPSEFDVVLLEFTEKQKVHVIKAVMDLKSIDVRKAKLLVESTPRTIRRAVSEDEALAAKADLEDAGATVELKSRRPYPLF